MIEVRNFRWATADDLKKIEQEFKAKSAMIADKADNPLLTEALGMKYLPSDQEDDGYAD